MGTRGRGDIIHQRGPGSLSTYTGNAPTHTSSPPLSLIHNTHTHTRTLSHTPNQGGMNIQTQSFFGRSSFVTRRDKGNSQPTALWSEKVPRLYCPDVTSYQTAPWSLATRYSPPQSPFRCVGSFFVHLGNANKIRRVLSRWMGPRWVVYMMVVCKNVCMSSRERIMFQTLFFSTERTPPCMHVDSQHLHVELNVWCPMFYIVGDETNTLASWSHTSVN